MLVDLIVCLSVKYIDSPVFCALPFADTNLDQRCFLEAKSANLKLKDYPVSKEHNKSIASVLLARNDEVILELVCCKTKIVAYSIRSEMLSFLVGVLFAVFQTWPKRANRGTRSCSKVNKHIVYFKLLFNYLTNYLS